MYSPTPIAEPDPNASWGLRLHQALMPDYNRKATWYWWTVVALGAVAIALSLHEVAGKPAASIWQILAGAAVATIAGMFPVRVPRSKSAFAAGEVYIFLLLVMHGPAAAVCAAAVEATVGVMRSSKRWTSRLASPAMAALAMFVCAGLYQLAVNGLRSADLFGPAALVLLLMAFAALYSFANSQLVSTVFKLKLNQPLALGSWFADWGWVGLTYVATAALAALLFLSFEQFGMTVLIVSVPMLAMFLAALHYFFAQQEAAERERAARTEAAEREAAQSAAHVQALERSEKRFHSAFTHASSGMALVSPEGRVLQANLAFGALLGRDAASLAGSEFAQFLFGDDAGLLQQQLDRVLGGEVDAFSLELRFRHQRGREIWASLHCGFFADSATTDRCLIFQVHDVTARRRAEGRLQHIAYHDSLTNLPNRNRFHECLEQSLQDERADPARHFAVMYLDFDRFKLINDSLGHGAGDEFLVKVARRIQEHVRPSDVVARLGGDEFAILTEHLGNTHQAVALAERLQAVLRRPLQVAGKEITTSASIGITFSDVGYRTPEEVLRDADLAMYKAKAKGKAQYALFDSSLHEQATEQLSLEADLRRAIEDKQLSLVYQPIYELATRRLVSFEALIRWHHPERGLISPATFIPLAEESGLIEPISHWVTEQACMQLAAWHAQFPQHAAVGMHINASSKDLTSTSFVRLVADAVARHDLRPSRLTLEITENVLMQRVDSAADTLAQLQELGVGLSVDDFGTGYSSLSYLSTLPINSLKIDRSFVRQLHGSAENLEIVRAVINLGTSLGKRVIAEGIENDAQMQKLVQLGCGHGQGYLLAEPLSVRQATALLTAQEPPAEPAAVDPFEPRHAAAVGGAPRLQLVH